MCTRLNKDILISVDGGVDDKTSKTIIETGANMLVAGSYIFSGESSKEYYQEKINSLR